MNEVVRYELREGVALVSVANPPVNALTQNVRAGLMRAIEAAEADPKVGAVVIRAEGRTFPAGAELHEPRGHADEPALGALCRRIESCEKPVVAAIHGTALGGGLELALACHFRIALAGAQLGLPDVALGVVPSAGGSQRLVRLAGAAAALDMLIGARPVSAEQARALGIVDTVIDQDLDHAAFGSARATVHSGTLPRRACETRTRFRNPARYLEIVRTARERVADDPREAARKAVDLVEAALLLPFEAGLEMEQVTFEDLVDSGQARGLRHAFLAERRTTRVPELRSATARPVERVGIVGGGLMGTGIALACLGAGLPVVLAETDAAALARARDRIEASLGRAVDRGRIGPAARDEQLDRLTGAETLEALAEVDLVIEAVPEDPELKRAVFARLGAVVRRGAVLATNTSYLDVDALATAAGRPEDVMGLHFFSPAQRMRLVEVVSPPRGGPDLVATGFAFARQLGKVPIRTGAQEGFVANTLLTAYRTAADFLLEDGATPAQVDAAMRAYGFPLGPYQVLDLAGLDISWARRKRLAATRDPTHRYVEIGDRMCEMGWFGQKSGQGYYRYREGAKTGAPAPEVLALIEALRREKRISPRVVGTEEIQTRCVLAMANAGARLVEAGVALKPSDVDAAMILGFGFPRWHGGPMEAADQIGLLAVRNRLRGWADESAPEFWTPAPLFDELIKNGRGFDRLNG